MNAEQQVETKVGDIAGRLRGIKQLYQTSGWAWVLEEGARLLLDLQRERDSLAAKRAVAREALHSIAISTCACKEAPLVASHALLTLDGYGTEGKGG